MWFALGIRETTSETLPSILAIPFYLKFKNTAAGELCGFLKKTHQCQQQCSLQQTCIAWQQLTTAYLIKIQMLAVFRRLLERPLPVTKIYLYFSTVEFPSFMTCLRHLLGISLLLLFFWLPADKLIWIFVKFPQQTVFLCHPCFLIGSGIRLELEKVTGTLI